jgi:hypothetical protein
MEINIERERVAAAAEGVKHLRDEWMITVCDACLCACCWQGELYCHNAKYAGTTDITIREARTLGRESPDYWTKDESVIPRLLAAGVYA